MVLIIGGAYQGKRAFARQSFGFGEEEIFTCDGPELDLTKPCVDRLELWVRACLENGTDPVQYLEARRAQWEDSVLICRDIFCGVVPLGGENRAWRQTTGRLCQYLAGQARQVSRLFCGLEHRLK